MISVEHDKGWHRKVSSVLSKEGISNCELVLCEPEKITSGETLCYDCKSYTSTTIQYMGMRFEKYVKSIENCPDGCFDLVFVDGRARASCIAHARSKIRPGAYLMLDDSERQYYHDAISLLADCKRTDFSGISPYKLHFVQTSVWEVKS